MTRRSFNPFPIAIGPARHRFRAGCRMGAVLLGLCTASVIWSMAALPRNDGLFETPLGRHAMAAQLLRGEFIDGVGPYRGEGTAIVADAPGGGLEVRFSEFRVSAGPDLRVWLVAHPDPRNNRHVQTSETLPLGELKATSGEQAYAVPAGTDLSKYQSVVIWCKAVNSLFAAAALR